MCLSLAISPIYLNISTNILYAFFTCAVRAACPAHRIVLHFISVIILMKSTEFEATHFAVFL